MKQVVRNIAVVLLVVALGPVSANSQDWMADKSVTELNELVKTYFTAGQRDSALIIAKRAVQKATAEYGEKHDLTAVSINSQATLLYNMGYSIPAENLFEKAATIWAETPARDTMILGATFYNLGVLYKDSHKPMQSQFAYRKAQEFLEPRMDPNDMILANILTDLGDIYRERDVHDSAVLMYEDALPRLEASQPKHSLPVARLLNNMGISLSNLGSYAEAEQAYNKALLSLERVLGPDDLEVGHCIENLTSLYHRQARYKESLRLSVLAQEIFEKRIGKNSLEAVEMLYLRGIAHQRRKELDKAETMLVEARERLRTMPSQGTGRLVRGVYTSLEEVYSAAGKDDLASQMRRDLEARQAGTEE